jgi:glycosyltransferase involved in cell wall biosynthesis
MTPHHVLTRLARYFHVVWVNPAHHWRGTWGRLRDSRPRFEDGWSTPGFTVYHPEFCFPRFYRPEWLDQLTLRLRIKRAWKMLSRRGCTKLILYVWHPQFESLLRTIRHDLSCYHIDDDYSFAGATGPINDSESRLIANVDEVFVISPGLLDSKGRLNPHTTFVPEGVDFRAYATPVPAPRDIESIPSPRIGYTGHLKKQLDWPLLIRLVTRHPDWSFVLVGPENHHAEIGAYLADLKQRPNVYFLGAKTAYELAAYPQHFDVSIMPYRVDKYTNQIYPLKLHEYLASGRPVVAAPIRSLHEFSHLIRLPANADEWSEALAECLKPAPNSPAAIEARQEAARQHDWDVLVGHIAEKMCQGIGAEYMLHPELHTLRCVNAPGPQTRS